MTRRARYRGGPRGNTLVELTIVMLVMSVLTSMGMRLASRGASSSRALTWPRPI